MFLDYCKTNNTPQSSHREIFWPGLLAYWSFKLLNDQNALIRTNHSIRRIHTAHVNSGGEADGGRVSRVILSALDAQVVDAILERGLKENK